MLWDHRRRNRWCCHILRHRRLNDLSPQLVCSITKSIVQTEKIGYHLRRRQIVRESWQALDDWRISRDETKWKTLALNWYFGRDGAAELWKFVLFISALRDYTIDTVLPSRVMNDEIVANVKKQKCLILFF